MTRSRLLRVAPGDGPGGLPPRQPPDYMGVVPARRSPFWRYTAFQVPGWVLAGAAGWWLHTSLDVPVWAAAGILVAWVVKDMALYPLLRTAYEVNEAPPVERLIGARGVPIEPLAPSGYVRIGNELWRAETAGSARIEPGAPVEVIGARGLVLSVRPAAKIDGTHAAQGDT